MTDLVLGVDPGTHRTGVGVVGVAGDGRCVSTARCHLLRVIRTPSRAALAERLAAVHQGVAEVLAETGARSVAVEGVFVHHNVRSALSLGHARGVVLLAAAQAGAQVFEYAPATIKRAVCGKGSADKKQVAYMVRAILGLPLEEPLLHDASDALAVAICHLHHGTGAVREAG